MIFLIAGKMIGIGESNRLGGPRANPTFFLRDFLKMFLIVYKTIKINFD